MFSKSLKKEVARFLVCVMMLTNISPAFTMLPEYDIRVERQVRLNPVTQMEEVGFTVLAQKLVESTYQTIVNQFITPFMLLATIAQQSGWYQQTEKKKQRQEESEKSPQLYEILEKVKAEVKEEAIMAPSSFSIAPKPLETELSRGFCLAIPELGDLLISHEGDVVFDNKAKKIDKTLKISAPSQVILNNTSAKNIEVEATAAFLTGKSKVSIESLKFRGKSETDRLVNGLFIDKEAELSVSSLVLEDALLLNAGRLSITNEMDLSGGYMFNVGTLTTSADPSVLQNIAYLFNGSTGQINAAGRMLLETNRFANLGHIKADSLSIVTADSFNNEGTIETTRKFELCVLGRAANSGIIDGKSGSISISGTKFEHVRGRISSSKTDFRTEETEIKGAVVGQEGSFHGKTTVNGNIHLQHGIIEGTFTNNSDRTTFGQRLDLVGSRTDVRNKGKITTATIVSNASKGIIEGGELSSTEIQSKKHIQVDSSLPELSQTVTDANAEMLISSTSLTPKLMRIQNRGKTDILSATPELTDLQNVSTGSLHLESSVPLTKIMTLDDFSGRLELATALPNINRINLQNNATLVALSGADLSQLTDIQVSKGSTFIAESGAKIVGIKEIRNFGTMTSNIQLSNLVAVYNAPEATLHFLERIKIAGRAVSNEERTTISQMASLPQDQIALFNEGKILIKVPRKNDETDDREATDYQGIDVKGSYVASEQAVLRMERGGIRARNFFNDGIFYSPTKLHYHTSGNVTKWGRGVAEDGIIYDIESPRGTIADSFKPIINGRKKNLTIRSKTELGFQKPVNWNVDMNIEAPKFSGNEDLTVRSLKVKTEIFENKKQISARDGIDIQTRDFTNTSGRLQSHGKIRIQADGLFRNTGGGTLEKNVPEVLTLKRWNPGTNSLDTTTETFLRDIYKPELDKAGVITSGDLLEIFTSAFDNSFGILNASKKMHIHSVGEVANECGLIYSGGTATINGTLLKNGYMRGSETREDNDPDNSSGTTQISEAYQQWVSSGHMRHNGTWPFGSDEWIDTSHWETRYRQKNIPVFNGRRVQSTTASIYPGYIFSQGDLDILMDSQLYFGTIVSGGDIKIKGVSQENVNSQERGLIIAHGDVTAELQKAALNQLSIQARNIEMNLAQDLLLRGIITPIQLPSGRIAQLVNLTHLAPRLGFLTDGRTFTEQGSSSDTPTGLIPISPSISSDFTVRSTSGAGFIGEKPSTAFFMPSLQESIINQLLTLTLTPIYGRDILLNIDLTGQLVRSGARLEEAFIGNHSLVLPNGDPALLFEKSHNPDVEIEVDGEKRLVPLFDPYLLTDAVSRLVNEIKAEKLIRLRNLENIHIGPGEINLHSEDLALESQKQIQIAAEFTYSSTGNRVGINRATISRKGDLVISSKEGVSTQGVNLQAKNLVVKSDNGHIEDHEMPLDPVYTIHDEHNVSMRQHTETSALTGDNSVSFLAPKGVINQHGTDISSGKGGTLFESQQHIWQPAYEDAGFHHSYRRGYADTHLHAPKVGGMTSAGPIIFRSKDVTLKGVHIVANTISNPVDGMFKTLPAYATQTSESYTVSRGGLLGLGESTRHVQETREMVRPTYQISEHFESLGVGTYEMESTVMRALDATITKNLVERTAFDRITTRITDTSRGICAPRIKGDPLFEAMRGLESIRGDGDTLPTVFNLVSAGAQAGTHALTLANLAKNPNPFGAVTSILLNRFVSGPIISHTKTVTERKESIPHQSDVNVGILRIDNSRTHLEGVWNITDRGRQSHIRTSEFTTEAPRRTIEQTSHTTGWSVALSPAALVGVGLGFEGATLTGTLPSVSLHKADSETFFSSPRPMTLTADDLLITCDNAVIRGSKIHARLLEMIVSGDLTIESLKEEFRSESHSASIGTKLDALHAFVTNSTPISGFGDSRLGAVPTMRFVDEETLSEKVREVAQLVGQEKFYLTVGRLLHKIGATVGLQPDGVVVSDDAERINAGQILEEKVREAEHHEQHVFNPSVAELCGMMAEVDAFKQLRAKIELQQMKEGVPVEEREKTQKEIDEFLKKTEVMEKIKKTNEIKQEKAKIKQKIKNLEIDEIELAEHFQDDISSSAERKIPTLSKEETFLTKVRSQLMYYREREEFLKRSLLDTIYEMQVLWDNYIADHPKINMWIEKIKEHSPYIIDALFYTSVAIEVFGTGGAAIPLATAQLALRKGGIKLVTKLGKLGLEKAVRKKTIKEVTKTLIRSEAFNEGVITLNYLAANEAKDCGRTPEEKRKYIEMTTRASAAIQGLNQTKTLVSSIKSIKRSSNFLFNKKVNWNETSNAKRGLEFKQAIQKSLPSSFEKDPTKGIDAFDRQSGHALSIMTLDTRSTSRISDSKSISRIINRRAKEISSITSVENAPIRSKEIFIGIPKSTTSEQLSYIEESRKFTESLGIILTVSVEE